MHQFTRATPSPLQSLAFALTLLLLGALALHLFTPLHILLLLGLNLLLAVNGLQLALRYCLGSNTTLIGLLAIAYFAGLALSVFITAIVVLLAGWHMPLVAGLLLLLGLVNLSLLPGQLDTLRSLQLWDAMAPYCLLFAMAALLIPLWLVGEPTPRGYAFPSLFGHDLLFRIGFAAHVARGFSTDSIFMAGQDLPYYHLFYILPALCYNLLGRGSSLLDIYRLLNALLALGFVTCLVELLRHYRLSFWSRSTVCFLGLVAYSMKAPAWLLVALCRKALDLAPGDLPAILDFQMVSHGWYRDFLVEPHAVTVLGLFIVVLIASDVERPGKLVTRLCFSSFLLALFIGMDTFLGVLLAAWYGLYLLVVFWFDRAPRAELLRAACSGLVIALSVCLLYFPMGILNLDHAVSRLGFKPYTSLLVTFPAYLLTEYGLMVLLAAAGLAFLHRRQLLSEPRWTAAALLVAICVPAILLVQHPLELNVVQRKAGKVLQLALLLLSGYALANLFRRRSLQLGRGIALGLLLAGAVGSLSFLTDVFVFTNTRSSYFSAFIDGEDFAAVRWVVQNTPTDAVVQSLPEYREPPPRPRESFRVSLFCLLGERRMALGIGKFARNSQTATDTVKARRTDILAMFGPASAEQAWQITKKYGIDYVYVGTYERERFPTAAAKFIGARDRFERVYRSPRVDVFRRVP